MTVRKMFDMKYSLVLPIFNEEENLKVLYERLIKSLKPLKGTFEFIFVDDGSTDKSLELLMSFRKRDKQVKIISFSRNFGHQTAVTAGLDHVTGDCIAVLDADLQDPPEVLQTFFSKLNEGYDVVYAIRRRRKENVFKKLMYTIFYRLLRMSANIYIPLDSGDFCVMKKRVVDVLVTMQERNRFVRGLRSWAGFKQIGLEYDRATRYAGKSKYTTGKLFKLAFDGLFSFTYVPLRFLTIVGFLTFLLSVLGSLFAIYLKYFTNNYDAVPGFATTVILIMFMGGLNMFSIGLVGEYVGRIFDEVKQRPKYVIESKIGFE